MANCYDVAVRLLARRDHFAAALTVKLVQRGFEEEEAGEAVERLRAQGYLDDEAVAHRFLARRQSDWGRVRAVHELRKRGASEELARRVVAELIPEDDRGRAAVVAERFRASRGEDEGALARYLERRGFSRRAIVAALRRESAEDFAAPMPDGGD